MARRLTNAQIDEILRKLQAGDVEQISRSRSGEGFGSEAGQLYRVFVDENDEERRPLSEAELRAYLAALDLDNYTERYAIWALQQLGVEIEGPTLS
jgi:hypothetical protein